MVLLCPGETSFAVSPVRCWTSKQAQGCASEGFSPVGVSPRLHARMLAFTCKMSLFGSTILDHMSTLQYTARSTCGAAPHTHTHRFESVHRKTVVNPVACSYRCNQSKMILSCRGESSCARSLVGCWGRQQAQGCAGEGVNPKWLSPCLRARMLAFRCKMFILATII